MTARKVLLVCLLITLLVSVNGDCIINAVPLFSLCSLLNLCSLTDLITRLGCSLTDSLVTVAFDSGSVGIKIDTNVLGLNIKTGNGASVSLQLLGAISIATDLNISGASTVSVTAGSSISIGGNVNLGPGSVLEIGGNVIVQGASLLKGTLSFTGATASSTSSQTAWYNSTNTVIASGTPGSPAKMTGNGGVNADVVASGTVVAGQTGVFSSIYLAKALQVTTSSIFKVNGNVTVEGESTVNGELYLGSTTIGQGNNQDVWFRPLSSVFLEGTALEPAEMTGNGGVYGDCHLGDHAGVSPGNSPGSIHYIGNLNMGDSSYLTIDCEGSGTNQFDKVTMTGTFFRGGSVIVNFGNGFVPGTNDRIAFSFHSGATNFFKAVYPASLTTGVFTNLTTGFVYSEPDKTCYCQCVNV